MVEAGNDPNNAFWQKAYENNFTPLCSKASCRLTKGNKAEAEDVVSEAFLRAIRYVKNPEAIKNLFGYLWTTARRVYLAKLDKEHTAQTQSLDDMEGDTLHPSVEPEVMRILENKELEEKIRAKHGPLTPREKLLLEWYLEGYTCNEMAERLGEDKRLVRADLNALKAKVRYRLHRR
jgi:RNA polymerase sigma factor (sigma-70 family)